MADNAQQSAGDVRVEEVYITSFKGESVDITNFVIETILRESIYSPCMFGEMVIADAVNLLAKVPIIGNDFITIKMRTPILEDSPGNVINKTFSIYSITDRRLDNDRQQFFTINFMSTEGFVDNVTRISQKFSGGTDQIAEQIYLDFIQQSRFVNTKGESKGTTPLTLLDTPHNSNNFEFVSNYWSPFKCMAYLARNSIGNEMKMPNVLFFETNKGFYFGSITSIIQEQKKAALLYDEYNYVSNLDESESKFPNRRTGRYNYTSPFISRKMTTVESVDYPLHFDQLKNQDSGYYGNVTYSYDYVNKDIYNIQFDYTDLHEARRSQNKNVLPDSFNSFQHISSQSPIVTQSMSNPYSKINFKAGASGLFGENDAFDIKQVAAVSFRNTAMAELDAVKFEIVVPGKTDIQVGKLIRFNFPNVGDKSTNPTYEDLFDEQVSGIYLITGIRHTIDPTGHKMILEIVRDSYGDE